MIVLHTADDFESSLEDLSSSAIFTAMALHNAPSFRSKSRTPASKVYPETIGKF